MTTVNGLDSYFTSLISNLMLIERQPLMRLQEKRDSINISSAIYTDIKTMLYDLQTAANSLMSTGLFPELVTGRSISVSDQDSGYTVLNATASSNAVTGNYVIDNITLAKEHRVRSDQQTYSDQALGLSTGSGYIVLGGVDTRSVALVSAIPDTVSNFDTSSVDTGKTELGKGTYYVETRNDATHGWQFRLVDAEGKSVSIRNGSSTTSSTSSWQSIPAGGGEFDTGRGLIINFDSNSSAYQSGSVTAGNAAVLTYTAQGAHIQIDTSDSLSAIANEINEAVYAEGDAVAATIVDRQLIFSANSTGINHVLDANNIIDNGSGGISGVLHDLGLLAVGSTAFKNAAIQDAGDASFRVNGVTVTRSANRGLTDVISGVTLNLAPDAEGQSATVMVNKDLSGAQSAIQDFIAQFNKVQEYINQKTAITKTTDSDNNVVYTRGTLTDDTIFSELRTRLLSMFIDDYSNNGAYSNLRDIGISIDDNLQASISDSSKLETALTSNFNGVTALMDEVMAQFDQVLGRFTGVRSNSDFLDDAVKSLNNQISDVNNDISQMNDYLDNREIYLTNQYAEIQMQLLTLSYTQQMWSSIYGSYNLSG
jgi:flagellar hook-associated protein 2